MTERKGQITPGAKVLPVIMFAALVVMVYLAVVRQPLDDKTGHAAWPDMRINLNTAGVDELQVLPRIGPGLAERIVADRQANGPFSSLEDLRRVPHVGSVVLESIQPYVVVEPAGGCD